MQENPKQVELDLPEAGQDSLGNTYASVREMWALELEALNSQAGREADARIGGIDNWYRNALKYWENTPADFQGVLGGFGHTHELDIQDSARFLARLKLQFGLGFARALGTPA